MVASNHIHLPVYDNGGQDVIARSIQLIAGRSAQEFENHAYALRESEIIYNADLMPKKNDIGPKNTYLWNIYS